MALGTFGQTEVAVLCGSCGKTAGTRTDHGRRCGDCGRFAESCDSYCVRHSADHERTPGRGCPACREENRVAQERQEMQARRANPRMHNSVDAPRF